MDRPKRPVERQTRMNASQIQVAQPSARYQRHTKFLLVIPLTIFFVVFFVIPVGLLFASSFNPQVIGQVVVTSELTLDNYIRFFSRSNYITSAGRSVLLATIVSMVTVARQSG